jgi:hypothetical protein
MDKLLVNWWIKKFLAFHGSGKVTGVLIRVLYRAP